MALFLSLNKTMPDYYYESVNKMHIIAFQVGDEEAMRELAWIKANTHKKIGIPLRVLEQSYLRILRSGRMTSTVSINGSDINLADLQMYLDDVRMRVEMIFVEIGSRNQLPSSLPLVNLISNEDMF
jgi:hypothetical protein